MRTITSHTDTELFAAIAEGDENAFGIFFYRYNTKVYYFILHILEQETAAEELVQEVFLKLWLNRGRLRGVDDPGNYLFVMAKHRALDQLDKWAAERRMKKGLAALEPAPIPDAAERLFYKESQALVSRAVQALPEQQRLIFQLSKEQGLSRDEIAARLQLSPHTVKNHLGAAVKSIQEYLTAHGKVVALLIYFNYFFK